ncbi:hypothetical protein PR202_gb12724 [Eleusine coracana subsp. coracana]|uniref:Uncharacterized protein n=1 Tax=Eleusine coracana subsp. coracana TaxID=191504 RepID=A0AAV5ERV0_ELECO|nr:hypothetical protein PR202_gb12724 [Eleusine coracana subsp. coracana]
MQPMRSADSEEAARQHGTRAGGGFPLYGMQMARRLLGSDELARTAMSCSAVRSSCRQRGGFLASWNSCRRRGAARRCGPRADGRA